MNFFDRLNIYLYHTKRCKEWANQPHKILGWKSEESQLSRFGVIARQTDFNNKSVLALGCGYSDLKPYLDQYYDITHYTGVDQLEFFIKAARKRQLKNSQFIHADFARQTLTKCDIVVASGSLNYHSSQYNHLFRMIDKMYQTANEFVILNLLNTETFSGGELLTAYYPDYVLNHCKSLTSTSYIIENNDNNDFSIVLKKNPSKL